MSSSSAGGPPSSASAASEAQQPQQQQQQPSTSAAPNNTSLNVQVGNQGGPGGAMMSPHAGPSSQPDNRYAYNPYAAGKHMPLPMQRPMAPQQWPPQHGPDGISDAMSLSQPPPPSNYPGMYNNPQMPPPPTSGSNVYWMPPHQQQQQQQPRYPMHQQPQYPPGYGPPPPHHQGYGYPMQPPQQQHQIPPPGDWGRMPPVQMQYPQTSQPMQPPPPHQTLQPPPPQQLPPPQTAPITSQPSSSNIAAAAQALQSPGAASSIGGHEEAGDDTKSIRSTSSVPPPHTPARTPAATPSASATPGTSTTTTTAKATSTPAAKHAPPPSREEVLEKLCHTTDQIGPELAMQRRAFFETIMAMSERAGDALTGPPQVSKSPIDLHKLFIKVKEKGGFEQVTKDKVWKNLCCHANPDMSESSAAGYQLRRHYQKHLLQLECSETGKNMEELIAVADKQKKKKKEKEPASGSKETPTAAAATAAPPPSQPPPPQPVQQQPQQQQIPMSQQPPQQQTLQPPPQPYSQHPPPPHGVPPQPGQPGPSYAVDANGQPIPPGYGQPGPYGYGVPPGWGAPPPPHGYYPQQPRYPQMMMHPSAQQQHQQQQQPMQMPPQQQQQPQHGMPPGVPPQQPGRPMDQASFEEHQKQMIQQQQQQRPASSSAQPSHQPACSTAPSTSEPQQQASQTPVPTAVATPAASRAPSTGVSQATPQPPPPSSQPPTSTAAATNVPQTSMAPSDGAASSALASQLGQPPPMGMYPPPQHSAMGMYGPQRMPYPMHQGIPNGYPPPTSMQPNDGQQHPGMYSHPSQQQMYGQQMPQGWNQQMIRPPMPPQGYPGQIGPPGQQPSQPIQQQPGQSAADFWQQQQHQQRAALAVQQQQQQQGPRKPYFPSNQQPSQASPQPSQRIQPQQQQQTPNASMPSQQSQQQQQTPMQNKMLPPQGGPSSSQPQMSSSQAAAAAMHQRQMQQQQQQMPGSSQMPLPHQLLPQNIPPPPIIFPPNSVEAIAQHHLGPQRRPIKKFTKDLISAAPRRIMMALKSNIHMEIVWALNALTVMLHDDTINPPTLSTEFLNIIIEHFRASLSLVFPNAFSFDDVKQSEPADESVDTEVFWLKVVEDAKKSGEIIKTKVKLPAAMKNSLGKDLNSVSRNGLKIISKDAEMPTKLKEWKQQVSGEKKPLKKDAEEMSYAERRDLGLPTEFAMKVAESVQDFVEQMAVKSENVKFSKWIKSEIEHFEYKDDVQPKESKKSEEPINLEEEYYDHEAPLDCSLVPRPIGIFLIPETIQSYVQLCLSWSNVIRGFSFNPANEQYLVNHHGLLRIIGRLLMLYVENGDPPQQLSRRRKQEMDRKEGKSDGDDLLKITTPEEDAANKIEDEKKRTAMVSTEKDDIKSFLLDTANQLRDDAFTILSFVSGSIDLFDLDSGISYPIFDALIHWTVSHSVLSKDPLVPWGIICPRDFCLEIIAKMSVIDHNVDLLLSTGSWKRIEEFVRIVSELLNMGEETPIREFALVIMTSFCQASEAICVIAALETSIVKNVISFMEAVDSKMHEVVSTKGMTELRTNPECIGTSIGMLRRAGCLLGFIVQYESCRKPFLKYMNNLINLTISHYMDTRVAIQIASIVHTAQLSNIDAASGKCLDVPDTPSVEPEILFPNKLPKFPKKDDSGNGKEDEEPSKKNDGDEDESKMMLPKVNGIKRPYNEMPSTSSMDVDNNSTEMIVENGVSSSSSQINGIHYQNGGGGSDSSETLKMLAQQQQPRINGLHKFKESPKQDVKAILRNSINHKQEIASGPLASKRPKLDVNGTTPPTNGRINGTSPTSSSTTSASNGPTKSSSSSSMAIVT